MIIYIFNLQILGSWNELADKFTIDKTGPSALKEIINMLNFTILDKYLHSNINKATNIDLTSIPNLINFKMAKDESKNLIQEFFLRINNCIHPNLTYSQCQQNLIFLNFHLLYIMLENKSHHSFDVITQLAKNNSDNLSFLDQNDNIDDLAMRINLQYIIIWTNDYSSFMNNSFTPLAEENEINFKIFIWLLYLKKKDFSNLAQKKKYLEIIFKLPCKESKNFSIFTTIDSKMASGLKLQESLKKQQLLSLYIAYIKWDIELFLSILSEIESTYFTILSSLVLLLNWKNVIYTVWLPYQHKLQKRETSETLQEIKDIMDKEVRPLAKIINLIFKFIEANMHNLDPFKYDDVEKAIAYNISQKENILGLIGRLSNYKLNMPKNNDNKIALLIENLRASMLQISFKDLKEKFTASINEKEQYDYEYQSFANQYANTAETLLERTFESLFCMNDFYLFNFESLMSLTEQIENCWVFYNNYLILAEHYYSSIFSNNILDNFNLSLPLTKFSIIKAENIERLLKIQNLIRNTCNRYNKSSIISIQISSQLFGIVIENLSHNNTNDPKVELALIYFIQMISIISGVNYESAYNTKCKTSEISQCPRCSDDKSESEFLAKHILQSINTKISSGKLQDLIIPLSKRQNCLFKLMPNLVGIKLNIETDEWVIPQILEDDNEENDNGDDDENQNQVKNKNSSKSKKKKTKEEDGLDEIILNQYTLFREQLFNLLDKTINNFIHLINDEKMLLTYFRETFKILENIFKKVDQSNQDNQSNDDKFASEFGKVASSLVKLTVGDMSGLEDLIQYSKKDKEASQIIVSIIQEAINNHDLDSFKKIQLITTQKHNSESLEYMKTLFNNLKNGQANYEDVFKMLDKMGDNNGTIGIQEFQMLARRLGMILTDHRTREIFAELKDETNDNNYILELNQDEFKHALYKLQDKQLSHALTYMGISPSQLYGYLSFLILLLLLIFSFIFLGIEAFAVGGAFGAVINSILPGSKHLCYSFNKLYSWSFNSKF